MYMAPVGEEGIASLFQAMEEDPHHIEAWKEDRRHCQDENIIARCYRLLRDIDSLKDHEREHNADGQRAGVAHKYFLMPFDFAEYIIIEERNKCTKCCTDEHSIHIMSGRNEDKTIKSHCDDTDARGQSVDAIDQIDGIGDIYHQEDGSDPTQDRGPLMYTQESI